MRFPSHRVPLLCLLVSALLMLIAPSARAQTTTADINGTITDSTGAVVIGASISATNPQTGLVRTTNAGQNGTFDLTLLPPGAYDVKIEAKGFASALQKGVVLTVGQALTLNFSLKPGATGETIMVTGEAPMIEATRSEIAGAVSTAEVSALPLLDRNFSSLMSLVPGVRPTSGFDPTKTRVGSVSVNGGDGRQYDFNVDGGDNKDNVVGSLVQNFTVEGIQEFNVVVNRYSADSGRTVGGVVNVISKSGTNSFHGTAFGQLQNNALNAKSYYMRDVGADGIIGTADDVTSCPPYCKPKYHRYHMGGSFGGPVIKDKFFFFGGYEYRRELTDYATDPSAVAELALVPLAQPVTQLNQPYFDHLLTVKLDYRINEKQNMFFRYGRQRWVTLNDQIPIVDLSTADANKNNFHDAVLQHNYVISPTMVNSFNFHFQDMVNGIEATPGRTFTVPAVGGAATNVNINFLSSTVQFGTNVNVPQHTLIRKYQLRDDFSWTYGRHAFKVGANYIYVPKLGGDFYFGANGYQVFFWDDPSTIVGNRAAYPQSYATPGAVREIDWSGGNGAFNQRVHQFAWYFQDDLKATSRLTLNLGLRWDANIDFLPQQYTGAFTTTNRGIGILRQLIAANPGAAAAQNALNRARLIAGDTSALQNTTTSWKHFQPRVGFAWDPSGTGKHVIRGGYGIAFDQLFQNLTLFSLQQSHANIYGTPLLLSSNTGPPGPTGQLATFRFGVDPLPAPASGASDDIPAGGTSFIVDPHARDGMAQQASIGWSYQLRPDYVLSVDYFHVLGLHEPRMLNMNPRLSYLCSSSYPGSNPADPRCVSGSSTRYLDAAFAQVPSLGAGRLGEIRYTATNNRSRFDSMNFQLRKSMTRRVMFQTSYVLSWSNSWGGRPTGSYRGTSWWVTPEQQFQPGEFVPTDVDQRHRFNVSGMVQIPWGVELAPIFQIGSPQPVDFQAGRDITGDGRVNFEDRACAGSTLRNYTTTLGCTMVPLNNVRGGTFVELDLRTAKTFKLTEQAKLQFQWEFYNLLNRNNFCRNVGNTASAPLQLMRPQGYCGGEYYGTFTGPFRSQVGLRFEF